MNNGLGAGYKLVRIRDIEEAEGQDFGRVHRLVEVGAPIVELPRRRSFVRHAQLVAHAALNDVLDERGQAEREQADEQDARAGERGHLALGRAAEGRAGTHGDLPSAVLG
jgi:hypothetical protein